MGDPPPDAIDSDIKAPFGKGDLAFRRRELRGLAPEVAYAGALSFLRRAYAKDLAGADLAIVGVPFDLATTNRPGARLGPRAVRAASSMIACWSRIHPWDFDPFLRIAAADWGDIPFDLGRPQLAPEAIRRTASEIAAEGPAILALGGDHFITYPLLQACAERHGPLSLVHFDAHSDTWRDEEGRIDHGTMFFHAAREGLIVPERSAQIGLRTYNPETHGFHIFDARSVKREGAAAVAERVRALVAEHPCYVTFDIDCLDPAFAPGTGTPEPGGLSYFEAQELLFALRGIRPVGMDVVEVAPAYDVGEATALAAAAIAFMLVSLFAENFPPHEREAERAARLAERAAGAKQEAAARRQAQEEVAARAAKAGGAGEAGRTAAAAHMKGGAGKPREER